MADRDLPITGLLQRLRAGDYSVEEELLSKVYDELRRIASAQMRSERSDHTLQPTALVHEAWLRLMRAGWVHVIDRDHFFRLAAKIMHRILVDHAKARNAAKRWGSHHRAELDNITLGQESAVFDLIALEHALKSLHDVSPRQYQVVIMHFFGGLTFEAIGKVLGTTERTSKRDWNSARLWLHGQLYGWKDQSGTLAEGN